MQIKIWCNYCMDGVHIKDVDLNEELWGFCEVEGEEFVVKFLETDDVIRFQLEEITNLLRDNGFVVRRKNKKPR